MTDRFFDASALVKRYVAELGSAWVLSNTSPGSADTVFLADVSLAEVAAALAAKQRAPRGISVAVRDQALSQFLLDCRQDFLVLEHDPSVIDLAVELTQRRRLRGYDAVQLAAALIASRDLVGDGHPALVFVSADNDLLVAARAEGLATENPLDHP